MPLHQTVHLLRHLMNRGMGLTLKALAVVAVEPSSSEQQAESDDDVDRPPPSWRRLRLITHDAVLDSLEDLVGLVAKATHSRPILRAADRLGDLRPSQVYDCSCCKRREIEDFCRFSDEQVVCATCLNGVVRRANVGWRPLETRLDRTTLEAILALEVNPYWRQSPDERHPIEQRRDTEAVAAMTAIQAELRIRWLSAMAPVAQKLGRFRHIVDSMEGAG